VGSGDFVLGFKLAGVRKTYEVGEEELARKVEEVMQDPEVGILVLHNDDLARLPPLLQRALDRSVEPTVLALGGEAEKSSLREKIKQSVGVDLWK